MDRSSELTVFMLICMSVFPYFLVCSYEFSVEEAGRLEDAILTNYHTMVRPNSTVTVAIDFGLYHISSLSNIDQELSLVGFIVLSWQDLRLAWNASDYGNITVTYLKNSQIWTPAIVLANSADGLRLLSDDTDTESVPIYVWNAGGVAWLAVANYLVKCPVDITFYPFDKQTCSIKISTWMYSSQDVRLVETEHRVNTQLYEENGEWDLMDTGASIGSRYIDTHSMSMVSFTLRLRRKHSFYILNMILPVVFTSFLGCLVFLLPIDSGEKNGFALTILLALSVIMTVVSDKIPPTSTHVCILSVYLLCATSISVLEVIATVFIQRLYSKNDHIRPRSGRLQKFIWILAKTLLQSNKNKLAKKDDCNRSTLNTNKISPLDMVKVTTKEYYQDIKKDNADTEEESLETQEDILDYKDVSIGLDRLLFIVFSVFTFILTLTFLLIISQGSEY